MIIRQVTPEDAAAIAAIYAPYVQNTAITFEYETPDAEEFRRRIQHTLEKYPYLVAETDGQICGYCYASAFKVRAAYGWSVETSIYVEKGCRGQGIGRALYQELERLLQLQNVCNLCACITYPNPASIAFHETFGYRTIAHFHNSGYKLDKWHDMIWMEKELTPHQVPPLPFIPYPQVCAQHGKEHL